MLPYFSQTFGNPSSTHGFGMEALLAVERARGHVAQLIGANPGEIVFTSGGTESASLAIRGVVFESDAPKKHVVTSAVEHPAVLNTCRALEEFGVELTLIPVDRAGQINPDDFKNAITEHTVLASVMLANNEVGSIQPIRKISKFTRAKGIPLHCDAVQAAGKIPVDVGVLGVQLLSLSSHKLYGPKGIGCLYIHPDVPYKSTLVGGAQENRRRAGTLNVPGIVGLGAACRIARAGLDEQINYINSLRQRLEQGITERIDGVTIRGGSTQRLPNTCNLSFEQVDAETLFMNLDLLGIAVSIGAACSSGTSEASHVLTAMGVPAAEIGGSIRISLGKNNSADEVDFVINTLAEVVCQLRKSD